MATAAHRALEPDRIRVLVVDDHPVLSEVIRVTCEAAGGLQVVGTVGDGASALAAIRELHPDVVVLDLSLPDMDGLDVARAAKADGAPVRFLVLSGRTDAATVFECHRAGVDGYLEKTAAVDRVTGSIRAVARGERSFSPQHDQAVLDQLRRHVRSVRAASGLGWGLTRREAEVLRLVAKGITTKRIASTLGISPRTVESHIARLYEKLAVDNRVQAVARAASLDLIDLD